MPPVTHRRHYSWPFGGPSTNTHEEHHRRQTADLRVVKNLMSQEENRFASFQPVPEDPLSIGDLYEEDDAISAGIVRSESTSSRHSRLWPCSHSEEAAEWHKRGDGGSRKEDTTIVSSVTEAEELPIAMLRRLLWSRLEKARLHPSVRTANNKSVAHGDDNDIMITVTSPLHLTEEVTWIGELEESDRLNDGYHHHHARPRWERGRKHRRCHSEQPRSWREPGPGLWTLVEEEPSG
ncbi:hypothetical protein V8E54_012772 [Elaphomyces granulatus]